MLATVRINSLDLASVQIYDLDAAALIVLTLQLRTEGAAFPDPGKPAVVADVHPAVGPHAAPLAPPRMLATTSTRPSGVMRESVSRAISTRTIDPSGMATGPSGNCKPDAMIFMLALKNASSLDVRCRQSVDHDVEARGQAAIQRAFDGWQ